jgi:hypothetical protein
MLSRGEVFMQYEYEKTRAIIVDAIREASRASTGPSTPSNSISRDFAGSGHRTGDLTPDQEILIAMDKQVKAEEVTTASVEEDILDELHFSRITDRYEEIAEAHRKTLDWAFDDIPDRPWGNLSEWLQSRSGIYWIHGRAGS